MLEARYKLEDCPQAHMSTAPEPDFDLEKLFLPAWAQASPQVNRYANFAGEPVRGNLTDPPAGYRVPSPEHPYGIGPDKKPGKAQATANDFNMGSAIPSGSGK